MKRKRKFIIYTLSVFSIVFLGVVVARRVYAQQEIEKRFEQIDINRDGKVTPDELQQQVIFKALDMDGNGEITKEEATRATLRGRLKNAASRFRQSVLDHDHPRQPIAAAHGNGVIALGRAAAAGQVLGLE